MVENDITSHADKVHSSSRTTYIEINNSTLKYQVRL